MIVIFDLDGTLLNTIDDLGYACNYALEQAGFATHRIESYPRMVGNGINNLIRRALPESERTEENVLRVREFFVPYYDAHNCDYTRPYEGIPEVLAALKAQGHLLAVASNKYQEATVKIINHYFPDIPWVAVQGQQDGIPVKPDPSIVFMILAQAHISKQETIYIGDSGIDMETARRACIDSVGVTWGFRPVKELKEYHANVIINKPQDIVPIVENGIPL